MNGDELKNFVVQDDQDNSDYIYDISERIFELRDEMSFDIISKNILDSFDEPKNYETLNYVSKFKEKYLELKDKDLFVGDEEIINNALSELSSLVIENLKSKLFVGIGNELDDGLYVNINEYLDQVETLYNFFIVRRYTNIKDYFKSKILQNKLAFIEKYKMALDDKTYDDLFLAQDKRKFRDISDAIIIHFINDIIGDIKSTITSAYDFFKDIVNLDFYEEFNNRFNEMLVNYGTDLLIIDNAGAAEAYLSILDNPEIYVSLRNDLLSLFLQDAQLSDKI